MSNREETADAPESARLTYRRLTVEMLDQFHSLAVDEHIRRFLLDGEVVDRDWCRQQIKAGDALFESRGLGLWLVCVAGQVVPIGFCGFMRFPDAGPEPELLYALLGEYTGKGYATEIALALIAHASRDPSLNVLYSAVDEPNTASARVLEKSGFEKCGARPGAFGQIVEYRLRLQ